MSGYVLQTGSVTPGHVAAWVTDGVVRDGGPATSGAISEVGITREGGIALAINNTGTADPNGYVEFGVGVSNTGTVTLYVEGFAGAPPATLLFNINGTDYPFNPSSSGNITGPGTSVANDLLAFNGTGGNIVQDAGFGIASLPVKIATVAALRANTNTITTIIYLEGYLAPGDGAEGPFWKDASDTTSADNGGTILVDANGARWHRLWQGPNLQLLWFGGSGASDFGAVQLAALTVVTALSATMPGVGIEYPSCPMPAISSVTWTFPSVPRFSLTLKGVGLDASVPTWTGSNGVTLNLLEPGHSFHIQDITFATASVGTYVGFNATQAIAEGVYQPSDFTRVAFRGSDTNHYWATPCVTTGVSNVNFIECAATGGSISTVNLGGGVIVQGSASITNQVAVIANFTDCTFLFLDEPITYGDYFQGMALNNCNFVECNKAVHQHAGSGATVIGAQLSLTGCQVAANNFGVVIEGAIGDIVISGGNLFYANFVDAVAIFCSATSNVGRINVSGNSFEGNNSAGSNAIVVAGSATDINTSVNTIFGMVSGIVALAGSHTTVWACNGNTIRGITTATIGIDMAGTNDSASIAGNVLYNLGTGVLLGASTTNNKGVNVFGACLNNVTDNGSGNAVS